MNAFKKLTDFLDKLTQHKIYFTLGYIREEGILVQVVVPGQRWEVEFFVDGSVEIERFIGMNIGIEDESALKELFDNFAD